jgi:hypothetical protein
MKKIYVFSITMLSLWANGISLAQNDSFVVNKTCGDISYSNATIPSTGTLRALVIYVQFFDDDFEAFPYTNDWPANVGNWQLPTWAYEVLSPTVQSQYTNPSLSGYFHNMSLGNFELIGDEYPTNGVPL